MPLHQRSVPTPIGELTLVADEGHLVAVLWPDDDPGRVGLTGETSDDHAVLQQAADQFAEYFAGRRTSFDLPLAPSGTEFQLEAWQALRSIPYGETRTYGQQAAHIGRPSAARAVGAANGANPLSIVVPCHRVVGVDGSLTGFAGGIDAKRYLLDLEAGARPESPG